VTDAPPPGDLDELHEIVLHGHRVLYRSAGSGERGFEAFLFVELPAHLVDVNVHPAKTEVRFADGRTVFGAVERAVREGLIEGVPATELVGDIWPLIVMGIVLIPAGIWAFGRAERYAKRTGKLKRVG